MKFLLPCMDLLFAALGAMICYIIASVLSFGCPEWIAYFGAIVGTFFGLRIFSLTKQQMP